jgi:hypothetical protein
MFTMMNSARLSVGLQGLALAERAFQDAMAYALERRQGRAVGAPLGEQSLIAEHADVRRMLLTMRAYIDAMRALIYLNAETIDLASHHPDPDIREAKQDLLELLIPISKAWSTDLGFEVTSLAIQVFGGMGYIEETGVAQHFRDSRITTIYEGTNGIQAMDLVGRKLPLKGGQVVKEFLAMMAVTDTRLAHADEQLSAMRANFATALTTLAEATNWIFEHGLSDPQQALSAATPYLRMFGLTVGGWLMERQALAALDALAGDTDPDEKDFHQQKLVVARFYGEHLLPQVSGLLPAVTAGKELLFALDADAL